MPTNDPREIERIEVRVVVAVNAESEVAAEVVDGDDQDEAVETALIAISNGVPLRCYVVVLDLPLPTVREIRARVENSESDASIDVEDA